jgi:hypothetical protein
VWLAWDLALWAAAILAVAWFFTRHRAGNWGRVGAPLFRESAWSTASCMSSEQVPTIT